MTVIRFRWVFCQLETLRQCLPQSVRRTLNELPESLDDTYERVMVGIKRANQSHAYRMLQCLAVAIRPLFVAELAELLAFDFDVAEGELPKLNSKWRWNDHEEAVLSTCSSLVTVVPNDGSPLVQFSHFSVKEFLMSDRLATSTREISQYHISLEDAHTLLTQASLAVLLRDPVVVIDSDSVPLTQYAARHWIEHAQVENVASRVRDGMEHLFDSDKPYLEAWVRLYDIDAKHLAYYSNTPDSEPGARPLYYAALCGFHELVVYLTLKYPQYASTPGGYLGSPLHSASFAGHIHIVRYLLRHGAGVDVGDCEGSTPLLIASMEGHRDVVQCLLEHGASVNLLDAHQNTPLRWAASRGHVDVVRVLLEHNADVHSQDRLGRTPLHKAVEYANPGYDYPRLVRLLLERGANASARDSYHQTPLELASMWSANLAVLRILLEHGADVDAEDKQGKTSLQVSLEREQDDVTQLLSGYSRDE